MDDLLDFFAQSDFHQTLGNDSFADFTFILAFFVSIGPVVVELPAVEKRWPRDHFHIKCDNNSEKLCLNYKKLAKSKNISKLGNRLAFVDRNDPQICMILRVQYVFLTSIYIPT